MDRITFVKKNDGRNDDGCCQDCIFFDACMQTLDLPYPFGEDNCKAGDYWEIAE